MLKPKIHRKMYLLPAGCLAFILFFTVFGERGLLRIYELNQEKRKMESRLEEIQKTNQSLIQQIQALKTDRRYVEKIARKELGLVHSSEVIYQFTPQGGTSKPASPKQGR